VRRQLQYLAQFIRGHLRIDLPRVVGDWYEPQ
jgi:hypothetical protein